MLLETCCFSVFKEEILGKKWQGEEKRRVTASMRKAMNIFGFIQVEMIAKSKLPRTILVAWTSAHLLTLMIRW